jgi:hypothetical protein
VAGWRGRQEEGRKEDRKTGVKRWRKGANGKDRMEKREATKVLEELQSHVAAVVIIVP